MLLFLLPLFQSLLYLASIPVCVAFCVSGEGGLKAGASAGAFSARKALKRAQRDMDAPKPRRGKAKALPKRALKLLLRLRLERVSLKGRLGLPDAAATALLCGSLASLGAALKGRAASVEVDVAPVFDGVGRLELRGMIRARLGQIILAAIQQTM